MEVELGGVYKSVMHGVGCEWGVSTKERGR